MKYLTQEEKAKIINVIGLQFVKDDEEIKVVLAEDSKLITPYSYQVLASMIIERLNNVTHQEKYRLRKAINAKTPEKLRITHILQIGKYFRYH